jgi:catechol 2,3-dioxygenase-like lactoylglutathione lyase family enzyme
MPSTEAALMRSGRIPTLDVDHVGFNVPDLDAALSCFTDAFGCELINRDGPVDYGNGVFVSAAMVRYGGTHQFELLEWRGLDVDQTMAGFTDMGGGHLCFAVADLDASLAAVQSLLHVTPEPPREIPDGRRFSRFMTPWGLTIQLLTRVPDEHHRAPE